MVYAAGGEHHLQPESSLNADLARTAPPAASCFAATGALADSKQQQPNSAAAGTDAGACLSLPAQLVPPPLALVSSSAAHGDDDLHPHLPLGALPLLQSPTGIAAAAAQGSLLWDQENRPPLSLVAAASADDVAVSTPTAAAPAAANAATARHASPPAREPSALERAVEASPDLLPEPLLHGSPRPSSSAAAAAAATECVAEQLQVMVDAHDNDARRTAAAAVGGGSGAGASPTAAVAVTAAAVTAEIVDVKMEAVVGEEEGVEGGAASPSSNGDGERVNGHAAAGTSHHHHHHHRHHHGVKKEAQHEEESEGREARGGGSDDDGDDADGEGRHHHEHRLVLTEELLAAAHAGDPAALEALRQLTRGPAARLRLPGEDGDDSDDDGDWQMGGGGDDSDDFSGGFERGPRRHCVNCTYGMPEDVAVCEECGHVHANNAAIFAPSFEAPPPAAAADAETAGDEAATAAATAAAAAAAVEGDTSAEADADADPAPAEAVAAAMAAVPALSAAALAAADAPPAGPREHDLPAVLCFDERMTEHEEGKTNPHPERPDRIRAVMARLERHGLLDRVQRLPVREATRAEIEACHTAELVDAVEAASADVARSEGEEGPDGCPRPAYFTPDTYVNSATYRCARLSAGGCVQVTTAVATGQARTGVAVVRPPGHHAESNTAMGFCFFNNAAIAARAAQAAGCRRVLVLDWDVHHGNGTQHIFEEDASVMYMSLHRYDGGSFYPGTGAATEVGRGAGEGATVNVPWLCGGMHDGDYLAAFHHVLLPIAYEFAPDLLIVSAGFDAAAGDPIGGCDVSPQGFAHMASLLKGVAPMVVLLEGGYNLTATAASVEAVVRVALGERAPPLPGRRVPSPQGMAAIKMAAAAHADHWGCMALLQNVGAPDALELAELRADAMGLGGGGSGGSGMDDDDSSGMDDDEDDTSSSSGDEDGGAGGERAAEAERSGADADMPQAVAVTAGVPPVLAAAAAAAEEAAAAAAAEPPPPACSGRPKRASAVAAAAHVAAEMAKMRAAAEAKAAAEGAAAAEGGEDAAAANGANGANGHHHHHDGDDHHHRRRHSHSDELAITSDLDSDADSDDHHRARHHSRGGLAGSGGHPLLPRKRPGPDSPLGAAGNGSGGGRSPGERELLRAVKRQRQYTTERRWRLLNALHISALRTLLRKQARRHGKGTGGGTSLAVTPTKATKADSI